MENKKYHLVKYTENYKNSYNFVYNNDNKLFDENLLMAFTWRCDGSYFIQNKNKEWNYITAGGTVLLSEWASEIRLPWMKMRDGSWIRVDGYTPAPQNKKMIGYKKCKDNLIVKLEIPEDAKRCLSLSDENRYRCDKAKVIEILDLNRKKSNKKQAVSINDKDFIYKLGEMIVCDNYNDDFSFECAGGIHFYLNFDEAAEYWN